MTGAYLVADEASLLRWGRLTGGPTGHALAKGRSTRPADALSMYMENGHKVASRFTLENMRTAIMNMTLAQAALESLLEDAKNAAEMSYSPYSGFKVGAALLLNNGRIVTGTNVENVSFGLTICAERSALVRAVSQYGPKIRVEAVAVANLNEAASPPCGACRQMLAEFAGPDAPVIFPAAAGEKTMRFGDILPLGFDMKLKSHVERG